MELKSTKSTETNQVEMELQVSPEELNDAVNAVFRKASKKLNIPGFRKGHAPRAFIEKYYGEGVFFEAAVDHLYRPMIQEAMEKSERPVVAVRDFKIDEIAKDKGIKALITLVTKPEATIEGYKGIEVAKEPVVVTEGEIDHEIEHVRERNSRIVTVEDRAAQNGDIAVIDFDGYTDGKPFDGGKAENYELTLGAGQFIPGFEEQVIGRNTGEEFDVNVTFPEDYHAEELKGKAAVFKIKLHEIKKKELPEVDDEFVKDVSEFDNLADYRKDLEKTLLSRKEEAAKADVENQLADAVIEKTQADIPHEMIDNEVEDMINSFAYRLQSQGLSLETYLKYTGMTTENLHEQYHEQAEKQVRLRLGLEKIVQLEDITAAEEETEEEYKRLAEAYNMPLEQVKKMISPESVNADVSTRKAVDLLRETAKITEAKKEEKAEEETKAETEG